MMPRVAPGQVWCILPSPMARVPVRFRVDRIEGDVAHVTILGSNARETVYRVRTLERGLRGAKLMENADGTVPPPPEPLKGHPSRNRTASDGRKLKAPRGLSPAERSVWLTEHGSNNPNPRRRSA